MSEMEREKQSRTEFAKLCADNRSQEGENVEARVYSGLWQDSGGSIHV